MRKYPIGPLYGLLAALLFGVSTPFAKVLLEHSGPVMLAGLLYLGSGLGLGAWRLLSPGRERHAALTRRDLPWLGAAILCGGVVAPVLLMFGLRSLGASTSSLLLNLEGVFTALLAWFLFRENFDGRIFAGMAAILAGAVLLAWPSSGTRWSLAVLPICGACMAWALDNNLTRRVSASDPVQIAGLKGIVAGSVNIALAFALAERLPVAWVLAAALLLGFLCYGASLTCFVLSLRHLGTARTGAYFSTAPFVGAALSVFLFREMPGTMFWAAGLLMALGVWLHLSENHEHDHTHEPVAHEHEHTHDEHHRHEHSAADLGGEPHSHYHEHPGLTHRHPHYPDIHHRHRH